MERQARLLLLLIPLMACAAFPRMAHAQQEYGDFVYTHATDAMDASDRSYVFTPATDEPSMGIAWKCLRDGLNVLLLFGSKYLGGDSDDEIMVRYRVDQNPASETHYWKLFSGNKSAYMRDMERVPGFTQQAKSGTRLVLRVTDPLDRETFDLEFSLKGLTRALGRLPCAG